MALVYKGRGDYERAEAEHLRALRLRRQIYSSDNIDILNSLNGIGTVQNAMKKHDSAAENFESALGLRFGFGWTRPLQHQDVLGQLVCIPIRISWPTMAR